MKQRAFVVDQPSSISIFMETQCLFLCLSTNNLSKWITIEWKFYSIWDVRRYDTRTKVHGANKSKWRIFRLHHYYVRCTWMPSSPSQLGVLWESLCVISRQRNKLQQQRIQYKFRFIASCPKHECESMGRCQWDRYYYVYAERNVAITICLRKTNMNHHLLCAKPHRARARE